jgi:hypothetical protein
VAVSRSKISDDLAGFLPSAWNLPLSTALISEVGFRWVGHDVLRLFGGPLHCCAIDVQLPPASLSHHGRHDALALKQRRSAGFPPPIIRRLAVTAFACGGEAQRWDAEVRRLTRPPDDYDVLTGTYTVDRNAIDTIGR